MRILATLTLVGLSFGIACAQAAELPQSNWVSIPVKDPNREFYLDQASVHIENGEVLFWDKIVFKQPTQTDEASGQMIKEKRILHRANCKTQEWTLIRGAIYDEQGRFIEALTPSKENAPRSSIKLGTVAAIELARACKLTGYDEAEDRVLRIGPNAQ